MKKAIIKCLGYIARSLCDKDTFQDELQNLKRMFMKNGDGKENNKEYLMEKQPRIK